MNSNKNIMAHDVFISYSQADSDVANAVCKAFNANGINYWIDTELSWINAFENLQSNLQQLVVSIKKLLDINESPLEKKEEKERSQKNVPEQKPHTNIEIDAPKKKDSTSSPNVFATFSETVNGVSFDMVAVEGGTFMMGSPENEMGRGRDEKQHKVTLSNLYIGKMTVTQSLWFAVMNKNNNFNKKDCSPKSISWCNCEKFIEELNLLTGRKFSLPTEVQWEYTSRGGLLSQEFVYAGSNYINEVALYKEKEHNIHRIGIFDMSGNVWEWCQDWYSDYPNCENVNPKGPVSGSRRVRRGESKSSSAQYCRISVRRGSLPTDYDYNYGFRLALLSE